jgi:hypothetical protein
VAHETSPSHLHRSKHLLRAKTLRESFVVDQLLQFFQAIGTSSLSASHECAHSRPTFTSPAADTKGDTEAMI